jgi:hypothetical protein
LLYQPCLGSSFFVPVVVIIHQRHRKIGRGNVMGQRKGYGVGKSRTQTLGLGGKEKEAEVTRLREQELTSDGQYRDVLVDNGEEMPGRLQCTRKLGRFAKRENELIVFRMRLDSKSKVDSEHEYADLNGQRSNESLVS